MNSFSQAQTILAALIDELPPAIFRELNGGVLLLPACKMHPKREADDLYIMGEYHHAPGGLGRYITIYYGSMQEIHGHKSESAFKNELQKVLHHELIHHLESLSGERALEQEDARMLEAYKNRYR